MSKNFSELNSKKILFKSSELSLNNLNKMNNNLNKNKNNFFYDDEENLGFKTTFNFQRKSSTSSDSNSTKNNNNKNENIYYHFNNERKLSSPIFFVLVFEVE